MSIELVHDNELQIEIEQLSRNVWLDAKCLDSYRRHNHARKYLTQPDCMDDIERARDFLSQVLDDVRGVR